jgi:hypothetical protein
MDSPQKKANGLFLLLLLRNAQKRGKTKADLGGAGGRGGVAGSNKTKAHALFCGLAQMYVVPPLFPAAPLGFYGALQGRAPKGLCHAETPRT